MISAIKVIDESTLTRAAMKWKEGRKGGRYGLKTALRNEVRFLRRESDNVLHTSTFLPSPNSLHQLGITTIHSVHE